MSAPVAIAGNNQMINLPLSTITLDGSSSVGTGGATITNYSWIKTSGPSATITSPTIAITTVTGLVAGQYVFTLTVTDNNSLTNTCSVIITVNVAGQVYQPPHPSNFSSFTSDYDKVNWIDTPTWTKKKVYDKNFWLVIPNQKFAIKFGNNKPNLVAFLKTTGEQFGDAITPLNIGDYTVTFKCYDLNGELIIRAPASITNTSIGQVEYEFQDLDFYYKGMFYGEFDFTDLSNETFTLPDSKVRIQIIVF